MAGTAKNLQKKAASPKNKATARSTKKVAAAPSSASRLRVKSSLKTGVPAPTELALRSIERVLTAPAISLAEVVGLESEQLAASRRSSEFSAEVVERIARLAEVVRRATEVMGSEEDGAAWLKQSHPALGYSVPLTFAQSASGAEEVLMLLGRIEHSVYS